LDVQLPAEWCEEQSLDYQQEQEIQPMIKKNPALRRGLA
jgi:hypothetical protein